MHAFCRTRRPHDEPTRTLFLLFPLLMRRPIIAAVLPLHGDRGQGKGGAQVGVAHITLMVSGKSIGSSAIGTILHRALPSSCRCCPCDLCAVRNLWKS